MPERVLKYSGVNMRNLVPPVKINQFVERLPVDKRDSLYEIATELQHAGLIKILKTHFQDTSRES